jgi:cation diffusion facilitator CzcD-associated flavoprotein CzcO
MTTNPSVAIVGSGFSGLATAIGLKKAGYTDFIIFERSGGVGGVWQHNTYPGAACDVASSLYSFSFEPNPHWSRPFAPQAEIQAYLEHCVRQYGLEEHLRFHTEIADATFDDASNAWTLTDTAGTTYRADVFVPACGQLTRPSVPDLPGLDEFEGEWFHSAEWDHTQDLSGKRVAVIGSGASSVQLVPQLADRVGSMTVFQRSAEYLLPKPDYAHTAAEHWVYRNVPGALKAFRAAWWTIGEYVNPALVSNWPNLLRTAYLAPLYLAARAQLRLQIRDRELRAKLTPDFTMGCKRMLLSSNFYPALAKDHVDVVRDKITEIAPNGVVTADGTKHEVDVIVFATGFQAKNFVTPMTVSGVGGVDLEESWQDGPAAYLGMTVTGFPNLFLMYGPNTNFGGGSIVYILECQARYIVDAVRTLDRGDASRVDVRREAFDAFSQDTQRRLRTSVWATGGCTSWYVNDQGKVTNNWPGLMSEYRRKTRKFDAANYEIS